MTAVTPVPVRNKLLFVLIDGIGDVAVASLAGKTPLQTAQLPHLNRIAPSPAACARYYRGRGAFESMGAGLAMIPGDIAFKSNFATLDRSTGIVLQRRADRNFEGLGPQLCADLDGLKLPSFPEHSVAVKYATEHRCGVRVRGPRLSDCITGTDPLKDNLPLVTCTPTDESEEARMTSNLVNELSDCIYTVLSKHPVNDERRKQGKPPANCVLLRGCGSRIKIRFLQEIDQMVGSVMERLTAYTQQSDEHKVTLCVTGDHATPVLYGDHSCEPVPFTMLRVDEMPLPPDSVRTFDEMAAAQGGLGRFSGRDVMRILKQFMLMPKQCP
ncbi:2,3-bisphosphoglycerate-independent phosphoglycerate mutase-domain-containing protein [Syncephalis pseudoplumigaleata]|uniref:2,3-bisphosphoglycerate-independent phosphoglycerate mutase-domain-containing protein n=1 Tax=Syncephalis pseudoplumigaleata TaxID=1712513 RepID=A0A4P9Z1D1_9FUNG|nr:2,3-bisphosphoglycerate-independent phosphoglycerate mutase-domain-containing protein [Syncephalis pseudoplumigaleata]|eukprot:RKP25742.1 2,3-bisphosphoglycerate-independent phosphoglycerate mutase-domain-containing protein [Syncephalis pseudoplumigaleata]